MLSISCSGPSESKESRDDISSLKQTQNWQTLGDNGWEDFRIVEYEYNNDRLLIDETARRIQGDSLIPQFRLLRAYDENGDMTEVLRETWANDKWIFTIRSSFIYEDEKITQRIDSAAGTNAPMTYVTYTYDSEDYLISEIGVKDVEGNKVNHSAVRYTNNDKGLPIVKEYPRWSGDSWVNARKMELVYNGEGHHVQTTRFNWVDDSWQENLNYLLEIDEKGNRLSELWQRAKENGREDFMKLTYTYNDN